MKPVKATRHADPLLTIARMRMFNIHMSFPSQTQRSRFSLLAVLFLALTALTALSPVTMQAQGTTGSITGTVTDTTGAPIPGATVTITQPTTNAVHKIVTSEAGTFTVPQLPTGVYTVDIQFAGFKAFHQTGLKLSIDQVADVSTQLTIGSTEESVNVTSTSPVIQTSESSIGLVVDQQAITNIPLNGRLGLMGLVAMAPGVQGAGAQDQLATRGVTASIGTGGRNSYGGLGSTLDGVSNQEVTLQRGEGEVPSLGAIAEFKVLPSGAPAEFNQPSQIVVVSASGGNAIHGKLIEYNRSKGMGAKTYFGGGKPRPPYQRNEYAVHLDGPVTIPHLYSGRDRTFFFFAFEGFRLNQSFSDSTIQPTLLERQGDFSEFLPGGICAQSPAGTLIINPATGQPFPGNVINTPLNPVDQQLLNILYPKPTTSGCGTNTQELVAETSQATRTSIHLDHKLGEKDQLRFTYLRAFYGPSPTNGTDSLQGGNLLDGEHNQNFIAGWTHTFSPSLFFDATGSYFHLPIFRTPQNSKTNFPSIIPGLGAGLIQGAPQINITNITAVSESGSHDLEQDEQIVTSLTKVLAHHTIKSGISYLFNNHWNDSSQSPQRGSYTFTGHYTTASTYGTTLPGSQPSGIAFADFLLGDPTSTGQSSPNDYIVRHLSSQYGFYVQDDWKATSKLTVNAGIRYDLQWLEGNPYGSESLYVPSLGEVVVFGKSYPSASLPAFTNGAIPIALSSAVGLPDHVWSYLGRPKKNIAPRLGFADEIFHNTVIRGAVGIYYNLLPSTYADTAPFTTLPFVGSENFTNSASGAPSFTMNNPFSATGKFAANPSAQAQHKTENPYTEEYNLAMEHQFPAGVDVRVGYVGQHNLKQNNYGGPGNTAPNINLANPPIVGVTTQSTNLVQPFSGISLNFDPIFHSSMNSLQVGVHKQYNRGTTFGAEYQWTRVLGTENFQNPTGVTPNDSYGPVSGITPQVLIVNYSYELPFGHNKQFLASSSNLVDKVVSGWQFTGISTFQTGQPFSVTYAASGTTGLVSGRADRVPGVALYPANKTKAQWFNTAAFQVPQCYNANGTGPCTGPGAIYTPGGPTTYALYGNSSYDLLRGPRFQDWDLNLEKNTTFHERYKLQLRADSFNIFNHPNFGTPNAAINNKSSFGTVTSIASTPTYEQRTVEFAAKFSF